MPTVNEARAAKLSAAMAKGFGELFSFTARKVAANGDVNLPRIADGLRVDFEITGVWSSGAKVQNLQARGHADNMAHGAVVAATCVTIEDAAIVAPMWMPTEGDLCTRQKNGAVYAVSRAMPDGFGRTKIYLTAKKR